jgi:electron-transferring-flavoprotein dehydrogenase
MLAAEAAFDAVQAGRQHDELTAYPAAFEKSWLHAELKKARNFKQWFKKGLTVATLMNGIEQWLLPKGIRTPWTLHRTKPDHLYLKPAAECKPDRLPEAGRQAHLRPLSARCSSATPTTKRTSRRT